MSTTYVGDPSATQAPGLKPGPGVNPQYTLPADGDSLAASSVAQLAKESADNIAFLNSNKQSMFIEPWEVAAVTYSSTQTPAAGTRWNYTATGTASMVVNDPTSTYAARNVTLAATSGGTSTLASTLKLLFPAAAGRVCLEFDIDQMDGNGGTINFGLSTTTAPGGYIISVSKSGNWHCFVNGTDNDTAVAWSPGVLVRFKIVWDLIVPNVKIYVNDVLTNTQVAGLPAAAALFLVGFQSNAGGVSSVGRLGGISLRWSR